MQRLERFESTAKPSPIHVAAGSSIRVCQGSLWLTTEGQLEDTWLRPGEQWHAAQRVKVWLSGEPSASFELLHPAAPDRAVFLWAALLRYVLTAVTRPQSRLVFSGFGS